jgi:hypothetical protein
MLDGKDADTASSKAWQIRPSFKYDVLTLLNTLTGDSYYLQYYRIEHAYFEPLLTPPARVALVSLKR